MNGAIIAQFVGSALTSVLVSSGCTLLLKTWLESRLRHDVERRLMTLRHEYDVELEQLKTQMEARLDATRGLIGRRLEAYPKVVESIYRVRNVARDIVAHGIADAPLADLEQRRTELEDAVFAYRLDFERDDVFADIHSFKNAIKKLERLMLQRGAFDHNPKEMERISVELVSVGSQIEEQYLHLVQQLSRSIGLSPDAFQAR